MPPVDIVNSELIKYADMLRTENAGLKAEITQLRKDLRTHVTLCERRFQEISEAFQTLSDPVKRKMYDEQLDAAKTAADAAAAAKRFRAASWNTEVPDVASRLRNAKREEPGMPPHIIAGTLAFVTGNFIMVINWLGG